MFELEGISKRYPGVTALDGVQVTLEPGRVHALVGENGAGKSTLLKILGGAVAPDAGRLVLDGAEVTFKTPRRALDAGVMVVHQELSLVPELGADANLFLGLERTRRGILDRASMRDEARDVFARLGLALPDPSVPVRTLSIAQRQLVELGRALVRQARVIALKTSMAPFIGGIQPTGLP